MGVIIVILLALLSIAVAVSIGKSFELQQVRDVALDLDEENKDLKVDLEMADAANRELSRNVRDHLTCLEMVLEREYPS